MIFGGKFCGRFFGGALAPEHNLGLTWGSQNFRKIGSQKFDP